MSSPNLLPMTPSLYRLRIPGGQAHLLNCYLWIGGDGVTLVDTGWPGSEHLIAKALAVLGKGPSDVKRVVLTHFHEDHAGAAAEISSWAPIEVVAGEGDASYIDGLELGPLPQLTTREQVMHAAVKRVPHGPPCRVDRVVSDGDTLGFAGGARVLAVPGHTPGSIALYLPAADAILTGDAVAEFNGRVILGVFNVDRGAARRSLVRIAATGAQIAGFGHGEPVLTKACDRIAEATDAFADDPLV